MHYAKSATTITEQITRLENRGMKWDDRELVERWLFTVGYYRLSAYWLPMEEQPKNGLVRSKQFKENSKFEKVVETYVFDRKLRLLVLEAIERIEIAIRSRWTNRLALESGSHSHIALDQFTAIHKQLEAIKELDESCNRSSEEFIRHYKKKYKTPELPPLWACTELMTLGQLSRWVDATQNTTLKKKLALDIGLPSAGTLSGTLHGLSFVRNICAHHHRLWNRRFVKRLPFIREFENELVRMMQGDDGEKGVMPDNKIYNCLVVLVKLLLHQSADTTFPSRLRALVESRTDNERAAMGFPDDWKSRPLWSGR